MNFNILHPYAVLEGMIFPAFLFPTTNFYFSFIGLVVALVLAYFGQGLMKVAMSSVFVVYIGEFLFLKSKSIPVN